MKAYPFLVSVDLELQRKWTPWPHNLKSVFGNLYAGPPKRQTYKA